VSLLLKICLQSVGCVDESKGFRIVAQEKTGRNSEVFISYGRLNNAKLLEYYGFSILHNPFEVLRPPSTVLERVLNPKVDSFVASCLRTLNISTSKNVVFLPDGNLPWDTLTILRLCCLLPSEHKYWTNVYDDQPISLRNEETVAQVVRLLLADWQYVLSTDSKGETDLGLHSLDGRLAQAMRYRRCRRQIAERYFQ
jgi:hypothetical protein